MICDEISHQINNSEWKIFAIKLRLTTSVDLVGLVIQISLKKRLHVGKSQAIVY